MKKIIIGFIALLTACTNAPIQNDRKLSESSSSIINTLYKNTKADWQMYKNDDLKFAVYFPSAWRVSGEGDFNKYSEIYFGSPTATFGDTWGITFIPKEAYSLEKSIAQKGNQFMHEPYKRSEVREKISINGYEGLLVTVTNGLNSDWVSKTVFINQPEGTFEFSNGASLEFDEEFKDFYLSFTRIE